MAKYFYIGYKSEKKCQPFVLFLLAELQTICQTYHNRTKLLEADKFDLEWIEKCKAWEVLLLLQSFNLARMMLILF